MKRKKSLCVVIIAKNSFFEGNDASSSVRGRSEKRIIELHWCVKTGQKKVFNEIYRGTTCGIKKIGLTGKKKKLLKFPLM